MTPSTTFVRLVLVIALDEQLGQGCLPALAIRNDILKSVVDAALLTFLVAPFPLCQHA